ncbi:MAG: PEP-CTERM sorting domain-containing protein [Steroidobacteraceae bacterium]
MKVFASRLALATAMLGAGGLAATSAHADTITIGLGINGGAITTEASGSGNAAFSGSFGGFAVNNVSGTGNPPLSSPVIENTNSLNVSTSGTGNVLDVYVTEQGLTTPLGAAVDFLSSFTENLGGITAGWSVDESTYLDTGNGLFSLTTALGSQTYTSGGFNVQSTLANTGAGPYSITAEYVITPHSISGSDNSTINVSVPEPATFALFGASLLGCALFLGRRRRSLTL